MAWLLPGSLLHADYAKELLHELGRRFGRVAVISLRERVFLADDVSETTEVLLCDNYNAREHRDVELITATGVDACAVLLKGWHDKKWTGVPLNGRAVRALSAPEELVVFDKICRNNVVATLGSVARINIGIVTGANHFFIVEQDFAREHSIPNEALKPIFAKSRMTPGIQLTSDDIEAAKKCGISCLLIDGARTDHFPAVLSYFAAVPAAARTGNVTFRKRIDWRTPDDNRIPDAFFPYMHHLGPRLIMNISRVNATNTIHRVYFKQPVSVSCQKLVALALLSTFSQLSAEIEGRSYGGGVLKHEPTEASNIRLLLPQRMPTKAIAALFDKVDSLLRQGLPLKATLAVDSAIIASMPTALPRDEWRSMEEALLRLRRRRHLTKV
jgi:hypothetical protein